MPKTPPPYFAKLNLTASAHADSIYYADLFRINGKVWALMGHGKSEAGRAATLCSKVDDLARDSVAFIRDGDALTGRYDQGAVAGNEAVHRVEAVVFCLNASETAKVFANRPLELREAPPELLGGLMSDLPYPAALVDHFFDAREAADLRNPLRRVARWEALTAGVMGTRWFLAPFMATASAKGGLYAKQRL